jgi:hypothetical protein
MDMGIARAVDLLCLRFPRKMGSVETEGQEMWLDSREKLGSMGCLASSWRRRVRARVVVFGKRQRRARAGLYGSLRPWVLNEGAGIVGVV